MSTRQPTADDVTNLHRYFNEANGGNPGVRDGILAVVRRLSLLDDEWVGTSSGRCCCWLLVIDTQPMTTGLELSEPALGWIYLGTPQGIHRRYPGGNQHRAGYDPTLRPWWVGAGECVCGENECDFGVECDSDENECDFGGVECVSDENECDFVENECISMPMSELFNTYFYAGCVGINARLLFPTRWLWAHPTLMQGNCTNKSILVSTKKNCLVD